MFLHFSDNQYFLQQQQKVQPVLSAISKTECAKTAKKAWLLVVVFAGSTAVKPNIDIMFSFN